MVADQENSIHAGWMDGRMDVVVPMLACCIIISLPCNYLLLYAGARTDAPGYEEGE